MVMKNMVSMSYIVAHLGQAELDCTVTLRERRKNNTERIYLIVLYCVIRLFFYGKKETLMVKYSCKENGDVQEGNTNRRKNVTKSEVRFSVTEEYKVWINDIKKRIKQSQIKASVKVNYELLSLYWDLGRDIVEKQENARWGDSFLAVMSKDLKREFPDMAGFSAQNLKHIRYWYRFSAMEKKGYNL